MSRTKDKKITRSYGNGSVYPKSNGKGFIGEIYVIIDGEKNAKKFPAKRKPMLKLNCVNYN